MHVEPAASPFCLLLPLSLCHFRYFLGRDFPSMAKCFCASQVPWFELAKHIGSLFIWKRTNKPTNNSLEIFRSIDLLCLDLMRPKHTPNPFAMWASFWHQTICMCAAMDQINKRFAPKVESFVFTSSSDDDKKKIWHHRISVQILPNIQSQI